MNKSKVPKILVVLCLLFSGIVEIASTQDFTPYPEGYLNELTRVNMSRAPAVFITKGGEEVVTQIKDGRRWNYAWYWDEVRKRAPEMFDADNNLAIDKGYAPRVNDRFLEHNPQFKKFKGQKLHHHHYKQGNIAYALPEVLHTGKGFTKLWHKFGKKAIFVIGTASAIYQLGAKANPFTESPFELWVQNEAEELELSNLELAMAQGYTTIKKFIENCRSCSNLSILFADAGEVAYYLSSGKLPANYLYSLFNGRLPKDGNQAATLLNKAIEFGIILRESNGQWEPIGIIDLPRYAE